MDILSKDFLEQSTNNKFIPIHRAGHGKSGVVWYSLPLAAVQNQHKKGSPPLAAQVCAVKVVPFPKTRHSEISVMKQISATAGPLSSRFPQILDSCDDSSAATDMRAIATSRPPAWHAMTAFYCVTVDRVQFVFSHGMEASPEPIPRALIAHVYIQLYEALRFLQRSDPPLVHFDLDANVVLDMERQDVHGFPNVVVLDFGDCREISACEDASVPAYLERDWAAACEMLRTMCCAGAGADELGERWCEDEEWMGFVVALVHQTTSVTKVPALSLEGFARRFMAVAVERRASVSEAEVESIQQMMRVSMSSMLSGPKDEIARAVRKWEDPAVPDSFMQRLARKMHIDT